MGLVLLGPPYGAEDIGAILAAAAARLAPHGLLTLEHARRVPSPRIAGLEPRRQVRAGDSVIELFELAVDGRVIEPTE